MFAACEDPHTWAETVEFLGIYVLLVLGLIAYWKWGRRG